MARTWVVWQERKKAQAVTYLSNHLQNNTGNGRLPSPKHGERLVQCTSETEKHKLVMEEITCLFITTD